MWMHVCVEVRAWVGIAEYVWHLCAGVCMPVCVCVRGVYVDCVCMWVCGCCVHV